MVCPVGAGDDASSIHAILHAANGRPWPAAPAPGRLSTEATTVANTTRTDGQLGESVDPNERGRPTGGAGQESRGAGLSAQTRLTGLQRPSERRHASPVEWPPVERTSTSLPGFDFGEGQADGIAGVARPFDDADHGPGPARRRARARASAGLPPDDPPGRRLSHRAGDRSVLGDPARFAAAKAVASYVGMIPSEYSSGPRQRLGKITKQGNSLLRFLWCEAAIHAVQRDAALRRFYRRKLQQKGLGKARVAAARKLGIRLWILLRDQIEYDEFCRRGRSQTATR